MNQETMQLIDAALDGSISPKDFDKLQNILRQDSAALTYYCEQADIHGRMQWELTASATTGQTENIIPFHRRISLQATAAAAVIAIAGISFYALRQQSPPASGIATDGSPGDQHDAGQALPQNPESSLARITNTLDARWQDDSLQTGSWLKPGPIRLLSGKAEITFDSGARVMLHGPAELDNLTPHLARLIHGKGVVHIPGQAEGFRLETPTSAFTDPECSFALAVDDEATEIHVIKGSIEASLYQNTAASSTLAANEARRLTSDSVLPSDTLRYTAASFRFELPIASNLQEAEFLRWTFDSMELDTFPENGNHEHARFPAKIEHLSNPSGDAQAQTIKGKFGRAIRFDGRGSYLSTEFPGIHGASERTIACWVRIPKDAKSKNAYSIFSWGEPRSQIGTKWQISWNNGYGAQGLIGALRTEFGGGHVTGSTDLRDGRWHHIASVYLGGASRDVSSQILHYVDGKLEATSSFKQQSINTRSSSNQTQYAFIGKRLEDDSGINSFHGDIDEIHVFPAALTPAQIEDLHLRNQTPKTLIKALARHSPESGLKKIRIEP